MTTRAKIAIKKGEEITFHYSGGLKGRFIRRKALRYKILLIDKKDNKLIFLLIHMCESQNIINSKKF